MSDFKTVNAIYGKRFPENSPARATIEAKGLPLGALVEIDAIAVVDARRRAGRARHAEERRPTRDASRRRLFVGKLDASRRSVERVF